MPRLLHIEDDPANRLLVRKLLTPAGFEVVDAADGLEGVRKATEGNFDIVLVDIAIPGLDGYEVTLRLRSEEALRKVPIIAITAEGSRDTSLSVGCDGFLQKPIDARSFVKTVEGYLGGKREALSEKERGKHLLTQSQRIVARLEQKVAELSLANERLRELDQGRKAFYRNISHELSTPMTPIVGYTKLLLDQELGELNAPQLKAVSSVNDCVVRLRGLIDNLLDITGIETGRLRFADQPFDLRLSVDAAILRSADLRSMKNQHLLVDFPSQGELLASGDQTRVLSAVQQILENASKFCAEGTTVALRVSALSPELLEVMVADQGSGIPAEYAERVFDPFFQIDASPTRAQGGTGVGLAVARGVAQGHGGALVLESPCHESMQGESFEGTCMRFTIKARSRGHFRTP